jgi:leucyl-tRNA synthetase
MLSVKRWTLSPPQAPSGSVHDVPIRESAARGFNVKLSTLNIQRPTTANAHDRRLPRHHATRHSSLPAAHARGNFRALSTMSNERRRPFPFDQFEPRWQRVWDERQTFHIPNPGEPGFDATRPKFYVLDMFPYPSGAGLHVGHPEGYTATDIIGRYKKMRGFNVLHPMGWDAFGLPAEQYAIKTGQHPRATTEANVAKFKQQLQSIGFGYDWQREVNTTDPGYFKWTQWIFVQLYNSYFDTEENRARPVSELIEKRKAESPNESEDERRAYADSHRLAYVSDAPVNWCPELGTVLANEEVIDGKSEVGGHPVERRPMRQWMLRITAYAQRLIDELDGLDWPESIKIHQRNWIGRSEGAEVHFKVADCPPGLEETIAVFTTRPDTLYGATYLVLAPEHPLVELIAPDNSQEWVAIEEYREKAARKSDLERAELTKDKTGVFTGAFAINPVSGERIPIWIADYVLTGYGTGAIMAVPAHDERDWEFAKKFALPIREVVSPEPRLGLGGGGVCDAEPLECFVGEGYAIHSGPLDGLPTAAAKAEIIRRLEAGGLGKKTINFKLRDWLFSRQRYWGEPFPIVWENGKHRGLDESELPVVPPELSDFKPTGTPEPPLSKAKDWVRYQPVHHERGDDVSKSFPLPSLSEIEGVERSHSTATRELNTMPQWAGSCWYYLRYIDNKNGDRFVGAEAERYWMTGTTSHQSPVTSHAPKPGGVDLYVGGTEHAVLHLLYARFWHKVLFDLGHVSTPEPFQRLVNQGLILGEDGQKMSKSRGNVVNPDDVIKEYGADALRLYEMFMGPLEATKPWSMSGVEGVFRFLARVWRLVMEENQAGEWQRSATVQDVPMEKPLAKVVHATIKKVGEDIEDLSFNTAIAQMMVCTNALIAATPRPVAAIRLLLHVLNPFAPHLTEELNAVLAEEKQRPTSNVQLPTSNEGQADEGVALDVERWTLGVGRSHPLLADAPWPAYDPALLIEDEIELPVQVNGKLRDKIVVKKDATQADIEAIAKSAPKIAEAIAGKTIKKLIVVPGRLVNIVVA